MPKRTDLKSILIIGAGPIVIGQACEFDYSGVQACKALREEGYKVILINSNPATIMTDPATADVTYIEPITWQTVEKIIAKERPDAILPTMGGQTALNCALDLWRNGVLAQVQGRADRRNSRGHRQGRGPPQVQGCDDEASAWVPHARASPIRWTKPGPCKRKWASHRHPPQLHAGRHGRRHCLQPRRVRRPSASAGLEASPTNELLIEESLLGWKEYEMEVVRDKADNCIIICSIENLDPMGVHTGDSITVAPAQTLTDKEYQIMRNASIAVLREIGVETGGSNVQFAGESEGRPHDRHRDEPARVALVGAGVQGHRLPDRQGRCQAGRGLHAGRTQERHHRGKTPGFVRALDRLRGHQDPAFRLREVPRCRQPPDHADEVGRRGHGHRPHLPGVLAEGAALAWKSAGRHERKDPRTAKSSKRNRRAEVRTASGMWPRDAFARRLDAGRGAQGITKIDKWFLEPDRRDREDRTRTGPGLRGKGRCRAGRTGRHHAAHAQAKGLLRPSPGQLLLHSNEKAVREARKALGVRPVFKRVDTCAAEFATDTPYMYSTYDEECEAEPTTRKRS